MGFYIIQNGAFRYLDIKIESFLSVGILWSFHGWDTSFPGVLQVHFPWCGWAHLFWSVMYCFFQIKTFHWLRALPYPRMCSQTDINQFLSTVSFIILNLRMFPVCNCLSLYLQRSNMAVVILLLCYSNMLSILYVLRVSYTTDTSF